MNFFPRTMVKTPVKKDKWLKSYRQKTTQKISIELRCFFSSFRHTSMNVIFQNWRVDFLCKIKF